MTVGQRIAQKRKRLGLSQEALGERLGVSRQAIYKWESDAALPEIEKLVNLSREFSVSVDWLLGEENGDRDGRKEELTPQQLRMVEEIVERYLNARDRQKTDSLPGPGKESSGAGEPEQPRKRQRWPWVAAALVLAVVFMNVFQQFDEIHQSYQSVVSTVNYIRSDVDRQLYGISNRIEELAQRQTGLTAEHSAEVAFTDYQANTVTIFARAAPRSYVEGVTAEFVLVSGGEAVAVPGEGRPDHSFAANITGPLSDYISVSVVFRTGAQQQTQLLEEFDCLYSDSFPDIEVDANLWHDTKVEEYAAVHVDKYVLSQASSFRLGLFQDQKLLAWYEHLDGAPIGLDVPPYYSSYENSEWFRLEGGWTMEPDHTYCVAAVIVDQYGRERIYLSMPVKYDPAKDGMDFYVADGIDRMQTDPADWEY